MPTDGRRIGTDPEWRSALEDFQRAGLRHVWFTLLGPEPIHDDLCGRPGAFASIVAALERCAVIGLQTGTNIVVSTRSVNEIGALAERVLRVHVANLRSDDPADIYERLLALEWPPAAPPDADLAARYGDTERRKVHIDRSSVRRRWIAAWRAEHELRWLASY